MEEEVTIRFAIDCASEVLPIQYKLPANLFKTTSLKTIRGFLTQQFFDEIGCIGFLRHGVAVSEENESTLSIKDVLIRHRVLRGASLKSNFKIQTPFLILLGPANSKDLNSLGSNLLEASSKNDLKSMMDCISKYQSGKVSPFDVVDSFGRNILHNAILSKDEKTVRTLLDVPSCNVLQKSCYGQTSLHLAATLNLKTILALLLAHSTMLDVSVVDDHSQTPLKRALDFENEEIVCLLLENGALKEAQTLKKSNSLLQNMMSVCVNSAKGDLKRVDWLLLNDISSLYARFSYLKRNALHEAVDNGNDELALLLLKHDKSDKLRSSVDINGRSVFHYACAKGNQKMLKILLEFSTATKSTEASSIVSYLNLQDSLGNTPLHLSLSHKHLAVSLYLLSILDKQFEINPTLLNVNAKSILDIACEFKSDESFEFISELVKLLSKHPNFSMASQTNKNTFSKAPISPISSRRRSAGANPDLRGAKTRVSLKQVTQFCDEKRTKQMLEFLPYESASPLHLCCVSKSWKSFQLIYQSKLFPLTHVDHHRFGNRTVLEFACIHKIPIQMFSNAIEMFLNISSTLTTEVVDFTFYSLISSLSKDSSNVEYLQKILDLTSPSRFDIGIQYEDNSPLPTSTSSKAEKVTEFFVKNRIYMSESMILHALSEGVRKEMNVQTAKLLLNAFQSNVGSKIAWTFGKEKQISPLFVAVARNRLELVKLFLESEMFEIYVAPPVDENEKEEEKEDPEPDIWNALNTSKVSKEVAELVVSRQTKIPITIKQAESLQKWPSVFFKLFHLLEDKAKLESSALQLAAKHAQGPIVSEILNLSRKEPSDSHSKSEIEIDTFSGNYFSDFVIALSFQYAVVNKDLPMAAEIAVKTKDTKTRWSFVPFGNFGFDNSHPSTRLIKYRHNIPYIQKGFLPWEIIHEAVMQEDGTEVVEALLNAGCNFNELAAWEDLDFSPLCLAVAFDKLPIIELLLKHKANPNAGIVLPLSVACALKSKNAPKIVRLLLDAGASVNEPSRALPKHQIFNRLVYTANPFPLSQLYNDWLDIERKQMRSEMHLPLSNACINGNLELVSILIKSGAFVNQQLKGKPMNLISLLPNSKRKPNDIKKIAIWEESENIARLLIASGHIVDDGSALNVCLEAGWENCVRLILKGSNINVQKQTLLIALRNFETHIDIIETIVSKMSTSEFTSENDGAKILRNLLTTTNPNRASIIKLLVSNKPQQFNLNSMLYTPIELSWMYRDNKQLVSRISGKTLPVFVYAILSGDKNLVKCVLECGAEIDKKFEWFPTKEETTSLGLSLYLGKKGISELLLEKGATCEPKRYAALLPPPFRQVLTLEKSQLCLELAQRGGEEQLISLFDIFSQFDFNEAIQQALGFGHIELVWKLIKHMRQSNFPLPIFKEEDLVMFLSDSNPLSGLKEITHKELVVFFLGTREMQQNQFVTNLFHARMPKTPQEIMGEFLKSYYDVTKLTSDLKFPHECYGPWITNAFSRLSSETCLFLCEHGALDYVLSKENIQWVLEMSLRNRWNLKSIVELMTKYVPSNIDIFLAKKLQNQTISVLDVVVATARTDLIEYLGEKFGGEIMRCVKESEAFEFVSLEFQLLSSDSTKQPLVVSNFKSKQKYKIPFSIGEIEFDGNEHRMRLGDLRSVLMNKYSNFKMPSLQKESEELENLLFQITKKRISIKTENVESLKALNLSLLSTCLGGQIVEGILAIGQDEIGLEIISKHINSILVCVVRAKEEIGVSFDQNNGCLKVCVGISENGQNVIFESIAEVLNKIFAMEIDRKRYVDPFKSLPKDLLQHLLSFLLTTDRKRFAMVSKSWYSLWSEHKQKVTYKQYVKERKEEVRLFVDWYRSQRPRSSSTPPWIAWYGARMTILPPSKSKW